MLAEETYRYRRKPPERIAAMLARIHPRARFVFDEHNRRWHVVLIVPEELRLYRQGALFERHIFVVETASGEYLEPCISALVLFAQFVRWWMEARNGKAPTFRNAIREHLAAEQQGIEALAEVSREQAWWWERQRMRRGINHVDPHANLSRKHAKEKLLSNRAAREAWDARMGYAEDKPRLNAVPL